MLSRGKWQIGVCSWSLQSDVDGVARAMDELGIEHIHLAVGPAAEAGGDAYLDAVRARNWTITSTMIGFPQEDYTTLDTIKASGGIVPDAAWETNCDLFMKALEATVSLGVSQLSMHAGFLDHTDATYARKFYDRIRCLADACADNDVALLMETGQESADDLRRFMEEMDHSALAINFDPANMILYNKDNPIDAVRILGPWIKHVHIKDAVRTTTPGEWGAEVPWGDGEVGSEEFLNALEEIGFSGALAIEREAGDQRLTDVRKAVSRL